MGHAKDSHFGYSLVALTFAATLVWVIRFRDKWQTVLLRAGLLQYLGKISYGVYILQALVYVQIRRIYGHMHIAFFDENDMHTTSWSHFCILIAAIIAAASLSRFCFEVPIARIRDGRLFEKYFPYLESLGLSTVKLVPAIPEDAK
ncbi:acyltransferase family protein [Acidobacterium sp. S8]|uniref:acyltransferase family protein n=1 Tax=Acidobacterium sp. S8 TaxID=1641854 RepID=UPI00131CB135|nr:acyltransferase family protein [Acidobacterium sp. S8]